MRKKWKKLIKIGTIRKRMIVYFILTTFLIGITSVYTFYNTKHFLNRMDQMFVGNIFLQELNDNITLVEANLLSYLTTKNSDRLQDYIRYSDQLREKTRQMNHEISHDDTALILKDIANMIDAYLVEADAAINAKRGRNINEYSLKYKEAKNIAKYINIYMNKLNLNQFHQNTKRYVDISHKLNILQILNIIIILDVIGISIALILWFTYRMTNPIVCLSHAADEISKGNFEAKEITVSTDDEIKVMAEAFNRMKNSIRVYIEELKNKAEMENRLMDQKVQNLKMKHLLKNAELQALQSQINPHFLFNTLNAGVQLAMLEDADQTSMFLENMASLFRYNLRKMDQPVSLQEEIDNSKTYVYLLKRRFADLIHFEYQVDQTATDILMPALIIQPLIENACIHGIGDMEQGGKVWVTVQNEEEWVQIVVEDNGVGMKQETIERILKADQSEEYKHEPKKGHTTGIGLNNVIHRLQLFYDREDIVNINSQEGKGASIIIRLPKGHKED